MTSLIYTRFTDQLKSRGRIPKTKILMEPYLDLKIFATSMIPSMISSGESWYKLLVPHKTTTFLMFWTTGRLWEHAELYHLQSHNLRLVEVARIWPKNFDNGLIQLLSSLQLLLFHNNFLTTWIIDCDGNLTNLS